MPSRNRVSTAVLIVLLASSVARGQTPAPPTTALGQAVAVGHWVLVTDNSGRETRGVVRAASDTSLAVNDRVIAATAIAVVQRTDSLTNGTAAGFVVGLGLTAAAVARCGRYEFSEQGDLCSAAAFSAGLFGIPIATFIGRQIDRALGNTDVYRRRSSSLTTRVGPTWTRGAIAVVGAVSW